MSHTLVDHHGVSVARYAGPGGVPMIQVLVDNGDEVEQPYAVATMTLADFHVWLCDLFGGMIRAALEAGDPPDPASLEALERALGIDRLDPPSTTPIRDEELDALRGVVAAVEKARAEYMAVRLDPRARAGPTESLDGIWVALGQLYRVRPALRPSGVPRKKDG